MRRRLTLALGVALLGLGGVLLARRIDDALHPEVPAGAEQAVLLHVRLAGPVFGADDGREQVRALESRLAFALAASGTGRLDASEDRGNEILVYLYGPSADDVLDAVRPTLDAAGLGAGSWANKRYGPPADRGARKQRVDLVP